MVGVEVGDAFNNSSKRMQRYVKLNLKDAWWTNPKRMQWFVNLKLKRMEKVGIVVSVALINSSEKNAKVS